MGFLRPKSRGKDGEIEQKKRNRLSKPLTNKSTTNLRASAKQEPESWEDTKYLSQDNLTESVTSPVSEDSRHSLRAYSFAQDGTRMGPGLKADTQQVKSGVAQLVARYESKPLNPPVSQSPSNDQMKKRPMSAAVFNASTYTPNNVSRPNLSTGYGEYRSSAPSSDSPIEDRMWDQLQDRYAIPTRRISNFLPGEATRKPSETYTVPIASPAEIIEHDVISKSHALEDKDDDNISETWTAPVYPSDSRPDTPASFEHRALGNLSLGSLHITNGRASPNLSEFSIQPKSQAPSSKLRDISSEYADSEAWEDDAISEDESETVSTGRKTPTNDLQRNFSFAVGTEERLTARAQTNTPEPIEDSPPRTPVPKSPETTSLLAEEYMAELPPSPFAAILASSSPASTGSVVRHALSDDFNDPTPNKYDSLRDPVMGKNRKVSNESHASSAGSQPSSAESKLSSTGSQFAQEDVFQSALEFQQFSAPRSPVRPPAPFMMTEFEQSDSGYSSLDSVRSMQPWEERSKAPTLAAVSEQPKISPKKESTPRKLGGFLALRPAIKSRSTAPAAPTPIEKRPMSSQSLQSAPLVTNTSTPIPSQAKQNDSDSPKQRKKLQKLKPIGKFIVKGPPPPEDLVVQRNPSVETYSVPSVPAHTVASLDLRVQNLPELERTVRNHNKSSSSTSTLAVPQDIRFPTPNPEPDEEENRSRKSKDRSKSRTRSKSRRRSMLEFFTGSKDEKRKSNINQTEPEMNIDDLGDVVSALGTNPYDIAIPARRSASWSRNMSGAYDSRIRPRSVEGQHARDITPHRLSYSSNSQRFMMDDHTASEYARNRSRSIHERDTWDERSASHYPPNAFRGSSRMPSFNDRGGIPGKNLRVSQSEEAPPPPMPPMPSPAEIRRLSGRYDEYKPPQRPHSSETSHWQGQSSQEPEDTAPPPPPPPPPHSPQPAFLDEAGGVEEIEDFTLAPPPPSHSPRPMDLEPQPLTTSEDRWADQARAWRARRQSAGETLRANRASFDPSYRNEHTWHEEEYPSIPLQPRTEYFDGSENWPSSDQYGQEWNSAYQQYGAHSQIQGDWSDDQYYVNDDAHLEYGYHEAENSYFDQAHDTYRDQPSIQHEFAYHEQAGYYADPPQREPSPAPSRPLPSRPVSRVSYASNNSAISLAEELHPEISQRPSAAPSFGRYSGGLQYSYEGKNKGFGGSSGTRSVSGKADGKWKGMALKQTYGVDLGDVPIMGVIKPMR